MLQIRRNLALSNGRKTVLFNEIELGHIGFFPVSNFQGLPNDSEMDDKQIFLCLVCNQIRKAGLA